MKNGIRKFILALSLLIAAVEATAQSPDRLSGTVTDENGQPIFGVGVTVAGRSVATTTNAAGEYSIAAKRGDVVRFTMPGYEPQQVTVNVSFTVNLSLKSSDEGIDEVVVVGYGTVRKKDLTGSVTSLSDKNIEGYKTSTVVAAMGGQLAGVQVTQMDGSPGAGFDVKIRGVGSINSDAGPMYVVDGFQVDNIDYLANSDILSMDILKDASAAAIYGARAANGVVLITTKSGKTGKPVIAFSGSANYREISKRLDVLSPYEFVKLQVELDPSRYAPRYYRTGDDPDGNPWRFQSLDDYIGYNGIDWQDEVFRPTWSKDYNLSVSGGNIDTKYTFIFTRYDENGLFNNSSFGKTTAKMRVNQKIYKNLTLDATVNYVNTDKRGISTSADAGRFNILGNIISARPTAGLGMTDYELLHASVDPLEDEFNPGNIGQFNPIAQAESVTNERKADQIIANGSLTWQIVNGLTFKTAGTY
ncbi:MAG: SusC/RagA family TonB-linked outer membrane protein [Rikenellaceae bacterium]|jgi:TonB-linked SusC/RagA family outer membrane protein|nr:SusC/RagA family TonB-linked outer membrane protein [Rikenellaceae bacterium]